MMTVESSELQHSYTEMYDVTSRRATCHYLYIVRDSCKHVCFEHVVNGKLTTPNWEKNELLR
jgi:hypothetical protein